MTGLRGLLPSRTEAAILAGALGIRMIHLAGILGDPLAGVPRTDPAYYDAWAQAIAHGDLAFDGPFFRAPLYAYFLGLLHAISGGSLAFARAVQLVLGLGSAFLLMRIGRLTLGRGAGLVAGAAYGIYPLALRYEGDFLAEGLFILVVLGGLLAYLKTLERSTPRRWLATGFLFGLATITRPTVLLFALLVPAVAFVQRRLARSPVELRASLLEATCYVVGLILPILPVTLHNGVHGQDLVPIASQGGLNFYIGNNPGADGFTALIPGLPVAWYHEAVALAETDRGRNLRPSEVSDYWAGKGLRFLLDEPGAAARLFVRKLYLFWWGAEISNNEHDYFLRRYSWPLRATLWHAGIYFPFGVVAPFALLGMALAWKRLRARAFPLIAFAGVSMVSVVAFFVCARFRLPAVPILLLFAAYGAGEVPRLLRGGTPGRAALGVVVGLGVLVNADPYHLWPAVYGSQALSYIDRGLYYASTSKFEEAESALRRAAALDPAHPAPHAWLGRFAMRRGDAAAAEAELEMASRGNPVMFRDVVVQAESDRGRLALAGQRYPDGLDAFKRALALDPESAEATAGAGFASLALGDSAAARSYWERALVLDPENAYVKQALAGMGAPPG